MQLNRQSYEEYFLLYADGELNDAEKKSVEEFVEENPDLAAEFSFIQDAVLQPDENIIFENKELLYRNEQSEKGIVLMRWIRFAAAAAVIIMLSVAGWLFVDKSEVHKEPIAVKQTPDAISTEEKQKPVPGIKESNANKTASEEPVTRLSQSGNEKASATVKPVKAPEPPVHQVSYDPTIVAVAEAPLESAALKKEPIVTDIVKPDVSLAAIDVAVEAREMEPDEQPLQDNIQFARANYNEQEQNNNMIYFANTSLTKKTKLREVLRKATRYIDRVTSLQ